MPAADRGCLPAATRRNSQAAQPLEAEYQVSIPRSVLPWRLNCSLRLSESPRAQAGAARRGMPAVPILGRAVVRALWLTAAFVILAISVHGSGLVSRKNDAAVRKPSFPCTV